MYWSFGIINNKLAEVFYKIKGKKIQFMGHCYVKKSEYKTKKEKRYIEKDIKKIKLVYRNENYSSWN